MEERAREAERERETGLFCYFLGLHQYVDRFGFRAAICYSYALMYTVYSIILYIIYYILYIIYYILYIIYYILYIIYYILYIIY